jgi:hypothetical protein
MSASQRVYSISKTEYDILAPKKYNNYDSRQCVKHLGSIIIVKEEGKNVYFKQHSGLIQTRAKLNKLLFYL